MKNSLIWIICLLVNTAIITAEEPQKNPFGLPIEIVAGIAEAVNPAQEDPNINTAAATLEASPSAIVAGCVNAITGSYFDSGIDLILPGVQPILVQHTFCNFLECHFSYKPALAVGLSKDGDYVHALYTDDNGSGIPYKAFLVDDEPSKGVLKISKEALNHLTNYSGADISGRTRWANSCIDFVRTRDQKQYHLLLGSGIRRIFECYERAGKKHQPGVPLGKFRLIEEHSLNGNKYLYEYRDDQNLREVKAVNKKNVTLASLECSEKQFSFGHSRTIFSQGDRRVSYTRTIGQKSIFLIEPSHGVSSRYTCDGFFGIQKYLIDKKILAVKLWPGFDDNSLCVSSLSAPVGETEELLSIYKFSYRREHGDVGYTDVTDALNQLAVYKYNSKYKRLYSITTYDENTQIHRKERFYWQQPECPYTLRPLGNFHVKNYSTSHIPSEYLLRSHLVEGDGIRHFCRYLEYDNFGNVIKNQLRGNLSGHNLYPVELRNGVPLENGCEVYTKISEFSDDGLNLLTYEEDDRKWVRQSYYPKTNLLQMRLTGADKSILKREYFKYDENGALIEEIWDDGHASELTDLQGITERHIRLTTPRSQLPIGLPEIVQEFYYDCKTGSNQLVKQFINKHSTDGKLLSQQHFGSDGQLAYTLYWVYDRLGNVIEESNALGEKITRQFDKYGNKIEERAHADAYTLFTYDHANRLIQEKEIWSDGQIFITKHRYNLLNQRVSTIDSNGHETQFIYNRLGHLTKTCYPAVYSQSEFIYPTTETQYNALGQAIATCDSNGHWTKTAYTIRGQIFEIQYPDGSQEHKKYSLDGLLIEETAKNGLITRYMHDFLGRIILTQKFDRDVLLSSKSATYNTFH